MFKRLLSSLGLVGSWLALSGFAAQSSFSPWWALIIVIVILLLLWWWLGRSKGEEAAPAKAAPVKEVAPAAPVEPDKLAKIEGIGPKVASVLGAAGIQTFAQLAGTDVGKLEEILAANKLQMMKPGSWPQQAQLAADGKWEELQVLQDELSGGK
jgi:hypothetical protein